METELYRYRFTDEELRQQRAFWEPLCRYLEAYIARAGATLDLGAGYCHFINNVQSAEKYALDVNEENLRRYADPNVRIITSSGTRLLGIADSSLDTVFASNVYEHFHSREDVLESFKEVHRVLRRGGRFVILQPNFAYCATEYFDFFDHRLAFTHRSMCEGLVLASFNLIKVVDRFVPFTSKSKLPKAPWLVALYLKLPIAWRLFGAQMLIVAEKGAESGNPPSIATSR
jgi:SAM-dependent methyltransferase